MQRSELENRVNDRRDITQIYKIIEKVYCQIPGMAEQQRIRHSVKKKDGQFHLHNCLHPTDAAAMAKHDPIDLRPFLACPAAS